MKFFHKFSYRGVACMLAVNAASYLAQTNYDVIIRWSTASFDNGIEKPLPKRITAAFDEVCNDFNINKDRIKKLSVYLTSSSDSISLGSIESNRIGQLGLPFYCAFDSPEAVPIEILPQKDFHSIVNPNSGFGRQCVEIMTLPHNCLKFLIARELSKFNLIQPEDPSMAVPVSPRTKNLVATSALSLSVFIVYQLFRFLELVAPVGMRSSIVARGVTFTALLGLAIVSQQQLTHAWLRSRCLLADSCVVSGNPNYIQHAIDYYKWRLQFNRFWYMIEQLRFDESKRRAKNYDPIKELQQLKLASDEKTPVSGYELPVIGQTDGYLDLKPQDFTIGWKYTPTGSERFTSDGESVGFGLGGIVTSGALGFSALATTLGFLFAPATSHQRIGTLRHKYRHK